MAHNKVPDIRDQPRITRLFQWDGSVIARTTHGFHRVDPGAACALPLVSPGDRAIMGLGTHLGVPLALCRDSRRYRLFHRAQDGWKMETLPATLDQGDPVLICGGQYQVLAFSEQLFWRRDNGDWRETPLAEPLARPDHMLVHGDQLFVGWGRGEFGGDLVSVEIVSGLRRPMAPVAGMPVTGLTHDHHNGIWVTQGLAHLGGSRGLLHTLAPKGWSCEASSSNWPGQPTWTLPPSSFDAVAFFDDVPHLLGGSIGIVRRAERSWERLTPSWPEDHLYVTCLRMLTAEVAMIGLFDGGVLVVNLRSQTYQRIILGWSF